MSQGLISYFSQAKARGELKKIVAILEGPFTYEFHDFLLALGEPEIIRKFGVRTLLRAVTETLKELKAEERAKAQTSRAKVLPLVKQAEKAET